MGGFLLSLISRLNSLWKCPNEHFGLLFRTPHTQEIDGLTLQGRPSTFDRLSAADQCRSFASVRKITSEARIRREKQNSVVLGPNGQFRALEKPPFWPSFSTGALSFRECPLFGVQPVLAAFVTTLQLGWWSVASLTFTRKCLLRASDCGCGNGFLFSRRPRPVSQSLQSALAWFQSALAWFRLLHASDCRSRCGNGFL